MEPICDVHKRLDTIEDEIISLKSMIIKISQQRKTNQIVHLKGVLKGMAVTKEDINEAKKSLFKVGA